jgi:hypothetical protein
MNPVISHLASTLLATSTDELGQPLDEFHSICDFSPECLEKLYAEYQEFISEVEAKITEKIGDDWESIDDFYEVLQPIQNQTECDYILTRNHEGSGFWDGDWMPEVSQILTDAARKYPEICAYLGDDDKMIYIF